MAKRVQPVETPQRYKDVWRVRSRTGPGYYYVRLDPRPSCQCGAWLYGHGAPCAHIVAVKKCLEEENQDA
jgi:hypothetical protein